MECCIPIWNCFTFASGYYLQFFLVNNLPPIIQLCTIALLLIAWSSFSSSRRFHLSFIYAYCLTSYG